MFLKVIHIFQALSVKGQESPSILSYSQTSIHCISKGELLFRDIFSKRKFSEIS